MTFEDFFPRGRLANFLQQLTAPQSAPRLASKLTRAERKREEEVLDLVLRILVDSGLGLDFEAPASTSFCRHLRAKNGAKFRVEIGASGGYDLNVVLRDGTLRASASALSFEALAMTLRSVAGLQIERGA